MEFGTGQGDIYQSKFEIHERKIPSGYVEEFKKEIVKERLKAVCGAQNFSLALRNSEHIVRYITTGSWFSFMVADETKGFYKDISTYLGQHESKINTPPKHLKAGKNNGEKMYEDESNHIEFEDYANEFKPEDENAHVVLLLGPTGSGKSRIANLLFNSKVTEASDSAKSKTKNCTFLQGEYNLSTGPSKKVIVVDTVGYCDSIISDNDIALMIKNQIKSKHLKIDRVLILCYGRIQKTHITEIRRMLEWLDYQNHKENFIFLYNKADQVDEENRSKNLWEMCSLLGVNPHITVNLGEGYEKSKLARPVSFPPNVKHKTVAEDLEYLKRVALGNYTTNKIEQPASTCTVL